MTATKVVIRILDAAGTLLGAVVHQAAVKGDACVRASAPVIVVPEVSGLAAVLSVHWADVNVETRVPYVAAVAVGQPVALFAPNAVLIEAGAMPHALPAITVRESVVAEPLTGGLGARGH